jgi:hypothetical protein
MATYSTNLALTLMATGEQSNTWGDTTNTNLGTLLEQAISGYVTQAITDGSSANTTITIPNGATGVARNMFIEMTGALTFSTTSLIVPANKKLYFIYNNTTGGFAVTVKVSGQTGVSVPNGKKVVLVSNGTDIVNAENYIASLSVGALTSGRVPYAGTAGLLQDSANLTFNGTTLTANTIGAFTLGGTVAGGGNNINNVIIGASSPLAGAFTTLSATGNISTTGNQIIVAGSTTALALRVASSVTGAVVASISSTGTSGGNYGLIVDAGTTSADYGFRVRQAGTFTTLFTVAGDGATSIAGTLSSTLDATHYGVTVGRGGGASSYNTVLGSSALSTATVPGGGSVAIGTQAMQNATDTFGNNVAIGYQAGRAITSGGNNAFIGVQSGLANLTGNDNTAVSGYRSLYTNVSGSSNVAIGREALYLNTASNNTAVGYQAGYYNTAASNVFLGYTAGYNNTTAVGVTYLGMSAGYYQKTGNYNVAIGLNAFLGSTTPANNTGIYNTAIGTSVLAANTSGSSNVGVGQSALTQNTSGSYNTAIGQEALQANLTANNNTAVGYQAGYNSVTNRNTYVGYQAGYGNGALHTTEANTAIGHSAGYGLTTGSNNTFVGGRSDSGTNQGAGFATSTGSYNNFFGGSAGGGVTSGSKNTIIGNYDGAAAPISATGSNYVVLSDGDGNVRGTFDSSGNFGIGVVTPVSRIDALSVGNTTAGGKSFQLIGGANAGTAASMQYGLWVSQAGARYTNQTAIYAVAGQNATGSLGLFGNTYYGVNGVTSITAQGGQQGVGVYGVNDVTNFNYNGLNAGVQGLSTGGSVSFVNEYGFSPTQGAFGGHFVSHGKASSIGVYADAYLDASPGAGTVAIPLVVATNGTQLLRVNPGGSIALMGAINTATGTGITFPATQSASTDANTLDDYEEGTWTPSLTSFTVVGSPTYTGFYTKVGRQVTVVMQLTATTISSTGSSFVNNLPFSQGVTSVGSMATMTDNSGSGSASNGYITGVSFYPGASSATQYKYLTATYFTS